MLLSGNCQSLQPQNIQQAAPADGYIKEVESRKNNIGGDGMKYWHVPVFFERSNDNSGSEAIALLEFQQIKDYSSFICPMMGLNGVKCGISLATVSDWALKMQAKFHSTIQIHFLGEQWVNKHKSVNGRI